MTSSTRFTTLIAAAALLAAAGCSDQNTRPSTTTPSTSSSSRTDTTGSGQSTTTTSSGDTTAGSATTGDQNTPPPGKTGIPACDDYLASYKGCHRAAGIYSADTIDAHYNDMRDTLLRESRDPDKRSALAGRCVSLAKLLKESLHGKSCEPQQPASASSSH